MSEVVYKAFLAGDEVTYRTNVQRIVFPGKSIPAYADVLIVAESSTEVPSVGQVFRVDMPVGAYGSGTYVTVFNGVVTSVRKKGDTSLWGAGVYSVRAVSRLALFRSAYIKYTFGANLNDDFAALLSNLCLNTYDGCGSGENIDGLSILRNDDSLSKIALSGTYEGVVGDLLDELQRSIAMFSVTVPDASGEKFLGIIPVMLLDSAGSAVTTIIDAGTITTDDGIVEYGGGDVEGAYSGVVVKAITSPEKREEVKQLVADDYGRPCVRLDYLSDGVPKVYYLGNASTADPQYELCYGLDFEEYPTSATETNSAYLFVNPSVADVGDYVKFVYYAKTIVYGKAEDSGASVKRFKFETMYNFSTYDDADLQNKVNTVAGNMLRALKAGQSEIEFIQPSAWGGIWNRFLNSGVSFTSDGATVTVKAILPGVKVTYDSGGSLYELYLLRASWERGTWRFYLKPLSSLTTVTDVLGEQDYRISKLAIQLLSEKSSGNAVSSGWQPPQPI